MFEDLLDTTYFLIFSLALLAGWFERTLEDKWHKFFAGWVFSLFPNQQCRKTEENLAEAVRK